MDAFISTPKNIPFWLRIGIWYSERVTRHEMLPAKLLAWYPKAAIGSGVLEAMVAHKDGNLDPRILKLVRVQASYSASCAFCIDMNSANSIESGISSDEILAMQGKKDIRSVPSLTDREILAINYAKLISQTPLKFPAEFISDIKHNFTEREIVIIASTAAQVNYWARLIQALGIPPAGFSADCKI
jgi:alkylhydroperoxidase family enzyme